MRLISDETIVSLKGIVDACYRLGGGVTSFALLTRVGVSTLVKYASRGDRRDDGRDEYIETMIPIDIALEADMRAGSPIITSEMARHLGFRLEPLATAASKGSALSERDAHLVLSEAMDVSKALLKAFEDGRIDALERRQLGTELRELIRAATDVLARLEDAP
ncbi:hypothetical protein ASD52_06530 [Ensifer sp. Root142]|uniref:hypothetical protein n=1 Tax=Ensifer sp. Root142 TaxID=1736461 RepID=UPI00070BD400|nr:hypothetical protein [Ensifer sp. Root142]KQY71335.1 hypothetical protein ASD52_06530 [Ensifer sp. Root142]